MKGVSTVSGWLCSELDLDLVTAVGESSNSTENLLQINLS